MTVIPPVALRRPVRTPPSGIGDDDMLALLRHRVAVLDLDLTGLTVVTEAATGAYAVTAVAAALAGAALVHAVARDSRHGPASEAIAATMRLARQAGVEARISPADRLSPDLLDACDILTNSGHLRPISAAMIERLPPQAVIALMFEAWEFRPDDLDLAACRRRDIPVAAVNERHPQVGVFDFLGPLCVRLLDDAGLTPAGRRIALLCDNPFEPFVARGLREAGAQVASAREIAALPEGPWEAVVVALHPERREALGRADLAALAAVAPGALIAQFWGDLDRAAARRHGFERIVPAIEPRPGHMGVLLSDLGPDPIVRLQCGGLKAAELAFRRAPAEAGGVLEPL